MFFSFTSCPLFTSSIVKYVNESGEMVKISSGSKCSNSKLIFSVICPGSIGTL
jgi:hypothetical protein